MGGVEREVAPPDIRSFEAVARDSAHYNPFHSANGAKRRRMAGGRARRIAREGDFPGPEGRDRRSRPEGSTPPPPSYVIKNFLTFRPSCCKYVSTTGAEMPRVKASFTIYSRVLSDGKKVWYYQARDLLNRSPSIQIITCLNHP
jgi:hypothetical protein